MVPLIEHKYSDTLLIFLMKGADPKRYAQFERPETPIKNNIAAQAEAVTLTIPPPKVIVSVQGERAP